MADDTLATDTTSLTEIINSELIETMIQDYALDYNVMLGKVLTRDLAPFATKTWSCPAWEKDAGTDHTESDTLVEIELQTTQGSTISAAQVGVLREITDFAYATSILGRDGLINFVLQDGAALINEMMEDDILAVFSSASNYVGTTGVNMSIADFVAAMAKLDTSKARGPRFCVLDDQQKLDLQTALAAAQASIFSQGQTQNLLNANDANGYVGQLFGVPVYFSNLTDTANTAADVCGAMLVNGAANPKCAPIGLATLWLPRAKMAYNVEDVADRISVTACYGCGEITDFAYCSVITDA